MEKSKMFKKEKERKKTCHTEHSDVAVPTSEEP